MKELGSEGLFFEIVITLGLPSRKLLLGGAVSEHRSGAGVLKMMPIVS